MQMDLLIVVICSVITASLAHSLACCCCCYYYLVFFHRSVLTDLQSEALYNHSKFCRLTYCNLIMLELPLFTELSRKIHCRLQVRSVKCQFVVYRSRILESQSQDLTQHTQRKQRVRRRSTLYRTLR